MFWNETKDTFKQYQKLEFSGFVRHWKSVNLPIQQLMSSQLIIIRNDFVQKRWRPEHFPKKIYSMNNFRIYEDMFDQKFLILYLLERLKIVQSVWPLFPPWPRMTCGVKNLTIQQFLNWNHVRIIFTITVSQHGWNQKMNVHCVEHRFLLNWNDFEINHCHFI